MRKSLVYSLVGIIGCRRDRPRRHHRIGQQAPPRPGPPGRGVARAQAAAEGRATACSTRPSASSASGSTPSAWPSPTSAARATTSSSSLPGIKNPQDALNTVGQTAELRFRPMLCNVVPPYVAPGGDDHAATAAGTATTAPATTAPATTAPAPATTKAASGTGLGPAGGDHAAPRRAGVGEPTARRRPRPRHPATTAAPPSDGAHDHRADDRAPAATTPTTRRPRWRRRRHWPRPVRRQHLRPDRRRRRVQPPDHAEGPGRRQQRLRLRPSCPDVQAKNTPTPRYLVGPTQATGKIVSTASAQPPDITNGQPNWFVQVNFTGSGSPQFDALAKANLQKQVAIVLDGVVVVGPDHPDRHLQRRRPISGHRQLHPAARPTTWPCS